MNKRRWMYILPSNGGPGRPVRITSRRLPWLDPWVFPPGEVCGVASVNWWKREARRARHANMTHGKHTQRARSSRG